MLASGILPSRGTRVNLEMDHVRKELASFFFFLNLGPQISYTLHTRSSLKSKCYQFSKLELICLDSDEDAGVGLLWNKGLAVRVVGRRGCGGARWGTACPWGQRGVQGCPGAKALGFIGI